jgi:hypothetical protein
MLGDLAVRQSVEFGAKGATSRFGLLQTRHCRRNIWIDPNTAGTLVKGDAAFFLNLRVNRNRARR